MMSWTYPGSRTGGKVQCRQCEVGQFVDDGRIEFQIIDGPVVTLMKYTCQYCGLTELFDIAVPRRVPCQRSDFEEILPE